MTKNEVAVKTESTALVDGDALSILEQFSGAGYGDVTASDFNIPRIGIIGALSPQLRKNDSAYIEGAEEGDIVDIGIGQVFKDGIEFLPVSRIKTWIRWAPRKSGQGIIEKYDYDYIKENNLARNDKNEFLEKDGSEIIETWEFYGLNLTAGGRRSFLPMKKSNLKVARRLFAQANEMELPNGKKAPLFFHTWKLNSFDDSSNGNTWKNWSFAKGSPITELELRDKYLPIAVEFHKQVEAGQVQGVDERDEPSSNPEDAPF